MGYEKLRKQCKIGMMGAFYPPLPSENVAKENRAEWIIRRSHELGCRALDLCVPYDDDDATIKKLSDLAQELDVELEVRTPMNFWELSGPNGKQAREDLIKRVKLMKPLKTDIIRSGFGRNEPTTSRYASRPNAGQEIIKRIADNLKIAAEIFEDYGVRFALENHCDIMAKEYVQMFEEVDSYAIGCALDTANGFVVYCDPEIELELLAPYVFTTHLKDMRMDFDQSGMGRIPFYPVGVAVGEGHVDIALQIETMLRRCKRPEGMHMIIELGWTQYDKEEVAKKTYEVVQRETFERSIDWLKNYLYK